MSKNNGIDLLKLSSELRLTQADLKELAEFHNIDLSITENTDRLKDEATAFKRAPQKTLREYLEALTSPQPGANAPRLSNQQQGSGAAMSGTLSTLDDIIESAKAQQAVTRQATRNATSSAIAQAQLVNSLETIELHQQQVVVTQHVEGFIEQYGAGWNQLCNMPLSEEIFTEQAKQFWALVESQPLFQQYSQVDQERLKAAIARHADLMASQLGSHSLGVGASLTSAPRLTVGADTSVLLLGGG
jgi:hypothetical protein